MSLYEQEHRIFQESVARFSEQEIMPYVDSWERNFHYPSEIFTKLGQAGFLGILIDEQWGGVGGDYTLASAWCEQFGRIPAVGFTVGVNMHSLIVLPALQKYGTAEAKTTWLSRGVTGEAIGAYAFTEPDAGSDLTRVRTIAIDKGDHFELTGSKIFITNGKRAHFVLVLAKTAQKWVTRAFRLFLSTPARLDFQ